MGFFSVFGLIDFLVHYSRFGPDEKKHCTDRFSGHLPTPSGRWSGPSGDWISSGFDPVNQECFGFFLGFGRSVSWFITRGSAPMKKKHCTDRFSGHLPDSIRSVVRTTSGRLDCIRVRSGEPECFWFFLGFSLIDFLVHYSRFGPMKKTLHRSIFRTPWIHPVGGPDCIGRLDCIRVRSGEPGMFWVSRFRLDRFPGSLLEVRPR